MDLIIDGVKRDIEAILNAPPSKSYTHRYLFLALLTDGQVKIENPLKAGDTITTLNAIRSFGARGEIDFITGVGIPKPSNKPIDCRRSGTTARIAVSIAALANGVSIIDGEEQLRKRPFQPLFKALEDIGIRIESVGGKLPAVVHGGKVNKEEVSITGKISSQFITSLLYLSIYTGLSIKVTDTLVSKGYVDITLRCFNQAGLKVDRDEYQFFKVSDSELRPGVYKVPGDYSSASFQMLIGALGGKICIRGLDPNDVHPDKKMIDILRMAGAKVRVNEGEVIVEKNDLEGFKVDLRDSPDLLPPVAILAAFSNGESILTGLEHTRYKETDRIETIRRNLMIMGIKSRVERDTLIIKGGKPEPGIFNSYGDHRIAIAFTIAAIFIEGRSIIRNIEFYRDSYPTFLKDLKEIGLEVMRS